MGTKLTALATELTAPTFQDLLYVVTDPGGTPADRKMTIRTLRQHYNVMDYGAVADGSTDDLAAFQAAIAAAETAGGGIVYIPIGDYRISARIDVPSLVSLVGQDMYRTRLILDDTNHDGGTGNWLILCGSTTVACNDITLANFCSYAAKYGLGDTAPYHGIIGFESVERAAVHNVYVRGGANGGSGVRLKNCTNFHIRGFLAEDIVDYSLAFLSNTKYGTVSDMVCRNVGEIIDFGPGNSDIVVTNVVAKGNYTDRTEEAIDMGGAERIVINNLMASGDWPMAVNIKEESGAACKDIRFDNCHFRMEGKSGQRCRGFFLAGTPLDEHANIELNDCTVELVGEATEHRGAIGSAANTKIDGLTVRGGRYVSGRECVDLFTSTVVKRRILFDGVEIQAGQAAVNGYGIYILNGLYPVVRNCRFLGTGNSAVFLQWSTTAALDATQKLINACIDNNYVLNFGQGAQVAALRVRINNEVATAETYNLLSICGNTIILDNDTVAITNRRGILVTIYDMTAIDYARVDHNTIYRVPTPTDYADVFGLNSTEEDNVTYDGS